MDARTMTAVLWLLAGCVGGVAHFALLRWNTALYVDMINDHGIALPVALQVLRLAATGLLLAFAAWHGALPLLLAALGVILARPLMLRAVAP